MTLYLKAIVGAFIAGLGALQVALSDGYIDAEEAIGAAIATLAALGVIWAVPNKDQ